MDSAVDVKNIIINSYMQGIKETSGTAQVTRVYYDSASIEKEFNEYRKLKIQQMANDIAVLISKDDYVDGEISTSEVFMEDHYANNDFDYVKEALMKVYTDNYSKSNIVIGVLRMISRIPYDDIAPTGPIMALGLTTHKNLEVRDSAIQCFERWNSKKGLEILKNIECNPKWLQQYLNKVICYIEEDGID